MSSTVRNINKNQIVAEDMALGVGKVQQKRNGKAIEGTRIDIPVPVFSVAEISGYSPQVSTRLILEVAPDAYVYYIYRPGETAGVPSNVAPGVWVPQNLQSDVKLITSVDANVSVSGEQFNHFLTVTNAVGCTVTVGRAERDLGFGAMPAVPCLIFVSADTEGTVSIAAAPGVTVESPGLMRLANKNSTIGLIAVAVDKWILMGDIAVV